MADYYCDASTGNDTTGDGSSGNPWATIQKAVDNATYGDTIWCSNVATFTLSGDIVFNTGFTNSGQNFDVWLHFKAWDNGGAKTITTPRGGVVTAFEVNGNGASTHIFDYVSMPTIARITIDGMYAYGTTSNVIRGKQRWVIKSCRLVANSANQAIRDQGGQMQFINTIVENSSSGIGLELGLSSSAFGCLIKSATGPAVNFNGDGSVVSNCAIKSSGGHGVQFQASNGSQIINCTIVGNGAASKWGLYNIDGEGSVFNCLFSDWDGAGGGAINTRGTADPQALAYAGFNSFWNCTAEYSDKAHILFDDTANDVTESSDPLTDPSTDDYSLVSGAGSLDVGLGID